LHPPNSPPSPPEPSDEDLARSFQQGNKEAGDILFARHREEFRSYARKCCPVGRDKDAHDLVQDAFLIALSKFSSFRPDNFRGWIFGIIHNLARTIHRADATKEKILGTQDQREVIYECGDSYEFTELLKVLRQTVASLDERHREIGKYMLDYFLKFHEMPSVSQIVEGTGISHGTVQRARECVVEIWREPCQKGGFWPIG
jgi:RNA polymerase sigma factor (sigma-70 family)